MRMLVVDDEYGSRLLLNQYLRSYGEIDIAVNGLEAVDAFMLAWKDNEPYDIIWLDILMPENDGYYVMKEIRAYEKRIGIREIDGVKFVITSCLDDPKSVLKAYKHAGTCEYLIKPLSMENVLNVFNKVKGNDE